MTVDSNSTFHPIFKVIPGVQSYDWGKIGSSSLAAQFAESSVKGFKTDEKKPYAELWMGTHVTLPSYTHQPHQSHPVELSSVLASNPTKYLSAKITQKYPTAGSHGHLPFLFKVLSIGKALSIQAHPDKKLGEALHKERPDVYKDPNHKPEMAIALTPFRGFCNFLPLPLLLLLLTTVPEMRSLIGDDALASLAQTVGIPYPLTESDLQELIKLAKTVSASTAPSSNGFITTAEQKKSLRKIFEILMSSSQEKVSSTLRAIIKRYTSREKHTQTKFEEGLVDLVLELNQQYPDDVGVLCTFVLNVVELDKGAAIFLKADEPHAYISGDIIECMATSDNVVRAGLTPKLRDVPTLISMLTYNSGPAHAQLLQPTEFATHSLLYDPPIEEFSVLRLELQKEEKEIHRGIEGPSLIIVTDGSGSIGAKIGGEKVEFRRGEVLFVAAETEVEIEAGQEGLILFRAFVEA